MFSVKKEIVSILNSFQTGQCLHHSLQRIQAHGQIENIVPLLCYNKNLKAQQAMDEADAMVRSAKTRFDRAARKLAIKYPEDTSEGRQIKVFVEGLKYNITGNQNWRYDSTYTILRNSD